MAFEGQSKSNGRSGTKRATSHDVARLAGVSQSTVSRVLRKHGSVSPAAEERVLAAVHSLGYTPSELGRSLATQTTRTIGMVVTDLENPFYPFLISPLHDELSRLGYRMLLITEASDDSTPQELLGRSVDGAILTTTTLESKLPAELQDRGLPYAFLTRECDGISADAAIVDNTLGASIMTAEVLRRGHRKVGAILGSPNTSTGRERERGIRVTLAAAGLDLDALPVRHGAFITATGYDGMRELLALDDPPSVVICGNDSIAIGALNAARGAGVKVPEEISVVGFDDLPIAGWELVELTTVRQPMDEMARTAARLLVDRIEGRVDASNARRSVFVPELILRDTLGAPPVAS